MPRWRFSVYVTGHGKGVVQDDINRLSVAGLEDFSAKVRYLAVASKSDWNEPQAKKLKGAAKELHEIRFRNDNKATRAVGFFGVGEDEFTITMICNHKGSVYDPSSALESADSRRKTLRGGQAATAPLQVDGEDFPPLPD